MKYIKSIHLMFLISTSIFWASIDTSHDIPVRHLKPPILKEEHWGQHILCHRPGRYESPHIAIEQRGHQIIGHNYGHGGSGWTIAPGCTEYLVDLFEQSLCTTSYYTHEIPITIIGAGVIGLFTAYELISRGYSNITIIAEKVDNLTSHKAGGFLAPSTMAVSQDMQPIIDKICFDAYRFYADIAQDKNPNFPPVGACIMPIYLKRHDERLKAYENVVMHEPQDVIIDFGNGKCYEMKVYEDGIFMDTGIMMDALTAFLKDKVQWVQKKILSFDELDAPCIFNCAGLGAQQINQDNAMVSVQGHLILLENQNPADMNYMISFYVDAGITESNLHVKRSIYMFPKHVSGAPAHQIGVIGGTFIEGATEDTPHAAEFTLLIARAQEFFGR